MKGIVLPIPPLDEQSAIVEHLLAVEEATKKTIQAAVHEIDLLREYRTRLIADVVTGKLDVREAAAGLPDLDPIEASTADLSAELDGAAAVT